VRHLKHLRPWYQCQRMGIAFSQVVVLSVRLQERDHNIQKIGKIWNILKRKLLIWENLCLLGRYTPCWKSASYSDWMVFAAVFEVIRDSRYLCRANLKTHFTLTNDWMFLRVRFFRSVSWAKNKEECTVYSSNSYNKQISMDFGVTTGQTKLPNL